MMGAGGGGVKRKGRGRDRQGGGESRGSLCTGGEGTGGKGLERVGGGGCARGGFGGAGVWGREGSGEEGFKGGLYERGKRVREEGFEEEWIYGRWAGVWEGRDGRERGSEGHTGGTNI